MTTPPKGNLDDSYKKLLINDFAGGLNVYKGAFSLAANESPDMLNVVPFTGKIQYRGGEDPYSSLPHGCDQFYAFYDSNGTRRFAVFAGGNLYSGTVTNPTLVASSVYTPASGTTPSQRIGVVDVNGVLYWSAASIPQLPSSPAPVALQFWNPATATHGAVTASGTSACPASPVLMLYAGSIVACGVKFGASAFQPNVFSWSAVNDPTNWTAANSQEVGSNTGPGSAIEFALQFGIAEVGVSPFRTIMIGRSDIGIYAYSGALGSLTESVVNCPVGCKDGASAVYMPGAGSFGEVIFLGTDSQFWATNGVTAVPVSLPILPILGPAVQTAAIGNPNVRFWAGYNEQLQYYFCDVAGVQYVYKWDLKCWSKFQGWITGPIVNSTDATGVPAMFIASASVSSPYIMQVGIPQADDNGTIPNIYYTTAYLHAGDPDKTKTFQWVAPFVYNTGTGYSVGGTSMPRPDGTFLTAKSLIFPGIASVTNTNYFILNQSTLNGPDVLGGGSNPVVGAGTPIINHGRLACPMKLQGVLAGLTASEDLYGGAAQFTVAYNSGTVDFELIALEVRYLDRGYRRDGGSTFNVEGGVPFSFNANTSTAS